MNVIDRFMAKVEKTDTCWNWIASKKPDGYGRCRFQDKDDTAHRVSYLLFKGDIPEHLEVRHACHNRACVNPDHLILGTHKENMDDSIRAGRNVLPNVNEAREVNRRVTDEQVIEIRELFGAVYFKVYWQRSLV